jgi:cupin fold WbuC family metalloprotein
VQLQRISPLATRSEHRRFVAIDRALVVAKTADAGRNLRRREIHCFHEADDDGLHRMLNAIEPGSYVRPHRHLDPPKAESLIVLSGSLGIVLFDSDGTPDTDRLVLLSQRRDALGIDIRAGVWHTFVALETGTVVFEAKPGPYKRASDKDFAPWAPEAETDEAGPYLARLEHLFRESFGV